MFAEGNDPEDREILGTQELVIKHEGTKSVAEQVKGSGEENLEEQEGEGARMMLAGWRIYSLEEAGILSITLGNIGRV